MIYLYCTAISDKFDANVAAERLKAYFSGSENGKYINALTKKKNSEASAESLFAYSLLAAVINKHSASLRYKGDRLTLGRNESGKPYFKNSHIKFNLSHSKGYIACAVSDGEEIGVDIEASSPSAEKAVKIAQRFLCKSDREEISSNAEGFARLWTKKEASVKFFGVNFANESEKAKEDPLQHDLSFHFFEYRGKPVTLCTSRNFGKIIFHATDC